MGFFGKSAATVKSLAKDIDKDRTYHGELTARLERHRATYDERAKTARAAMLADESDAVIAKARAARDDVKDRIATLEAEIIELDAKIAETVKQHDDLVTAELAERTAIDNETKLSAYSERIKALLAAARELLPVAEDMSETTFAAREIADVTRGLLLREFPTSLERAEQEVRYYVNALRSGSIKPSMPQDSASAPAPISPKAEIARRTVLALGDVRWKENGETVCAGQHGQCKMPVAVAARAIEKLWALSFDNPRVRHLSKGHVPAPKPEVCVDLDAADLNPPKAVFGADRHVAASGLVETIKV